ncbi:MAG TPA: hypothetical protein IAD08_05585 [Candidatus Scatovivens faecipullorum]|nr:hypothetical protein [Candidatus Scatovivens faecipullorum]
MRRFIENFITFILIFLIIIIFGGTVFFALDVFGVIHVPEKYSLASLLYSQIEVIAAGENLTDDIIQDDFNSKDKDKDKVNDNNFIIENVTETEEVSADDYKDPLEELERLQEEQNLNNYQSSQTVNVNNFYYEQLDEYGKIIYDRLYENIDKLKTGTYEADFGTEFNDLLHEENGTEVLNNSFQLAINALTFDNTDLFYIDVTKINLLTEITTRAFSTTYRVKIGGNGQSYLADGFWDEEYVDIALGYVEDIKNNIISKTTGKDRVEQIKIVHDYLVDTVEYDLEAGSNIYNIYGTLIDKRAVCEGYARAFKYILDDLEIPTVIACGLAKNSAGVTETHAWNYVQLENGQWYAIDVTWDDPVIIGSGIISDSIKYQYFLKGANKFFEDHFEDGNIVGEADFEYPKLSVLDYYN